MKHLLTLSVSAIGILLGFNYNNNSEMGAIISILVLLAIFIIEIIAWHYEKTKEKELKDRLNNSDVQQSVINRWNTYKHDVIENKEANPLPYYDMWLFFSEQEIEFLKNGGYIIRDEDKVHRKINAMDRILSRFNK
jgi:hypothetical protein